MDTPFLPDGSWADPLTKAERRELARTLARASRCIDVAARHHEPRFTRRNADGSLHAIANEIADLHMDVTERAKVATS